MKKRQLLTMSLLAILSTTALAQDTVKGLTVQTAGDNTELALTNIQSIRYAGTDMLFTLRNGTELTIPVADISVITFGEVPMPTLITQLLGTETDRVTVTDIQGRQVWTGIITDCPTTLRGLYIISNGSKSRKVIIR